MKTANSSCTCAICGSAFAGYRATAKYCSPPCQRKASNARWRTWIAKPGSKEKARATNKEHEKRTRSKEAWRIKNLYGLSLTEYDTIMAAATQCAVCSKAEDLVLDHCHATGKVRGVLCRGCNRSIGQLGDTAESVRKALNYLERP